MGGKKMFGMHWRRSRYIVLLLGVIVGAIVWSIAKINAINEIKTAQSQTIRSELGEDIFQVVIADYDSDENLNMHTYVQWWNEDDNVYYFFLPKSWEKAPGLFWAFNCVDEICVNEKSIYCGDAFHLEEGAYKLRAEGNEWLINVMYSSEISSLFLKTEKDSLEYLAEDKENIVGAEYVLFDKKGNLNNCGRIDEFACRGNVTFKFVENKKSYRIKLQEKSSILGMGEEKDWLLLANAMDRSLSRNMIVHNMANALCMAYTPDMEYVDLYVNGEYRGNYLLSEKVEVGADRVNIRDLKKSTELLNSDLDLASCERVVEPPDRLFSRKWYKIPIEPEDCTGGYLMEIEWSDRYGGEASGFISSRMQAVVVHNPKYISYEQIGYIADLYQDFEDAVYSEDGYNEQTGKYFYEYIDVESFATKYMIEELVKNLDASYTSCFLYKPEWDSKMYAGPVWDYDASIYYQGNADNGMYLGTPEELYVAVQKKDTDIWHNLYQQPYFREYVAGLSEDKFEDTVKDVAGKYIDENAKYISDSAMMNAVRWNVFDDVKETEKKEAAFYEYNNELETFLLERMQYLADEWKTLD